METWITVVAAVMAGAALGVLLLRFVRPPAKPEEKGLAEALQAQVTSLDQKVFQLTQGTNEALRGISGQVQRFVADSQTQIQGLVSSSQRQINDRLGESGRVLEAIQKDLAALQNETTHMAELGRDMLKLRDILGSPKLRGSMGEVMLERILKQALPPNAYRLPYKFDDGALVDAAVIFREGPDDVARVVPIDSKFPLENFRRAQESGISEEEKSSRWKDFLRDVKARVDEIAGRYIRPGEGTFDFAFMYVPSESVHYEIIVQDEKLGTGGSLLDYAAGKKVVPVSPNSLFAYLQVVVLGLKGMKVEREARHILEGLEKVQKDFCKFRDDFERVGKKISEADRAWHEAENRYRLLNGRMERVTGHTPEEPALEEGAAALPQGSPRET